MRLLAIESSLFNIQTSPIAHFLLNHQLKYSQDGFHAEDGRQHCVRRHDLWEGRYVKAILEANNQSV